jgi:hypothetical protein
VYCPVNRIARFCLKKCRFPLKYAPFGSIEDAKSNHIYRIADTTTVGTVNDDYIRNGLPHTLQGRIIPPYASLLRIHGPFLFGTTEKLVEATVKASARLAFSRLRRTGEHHAKRSVRPRSH